MRAGRVLAAALIAAALTACAGNRGADDPANELPSGYVDVPADGASVHAETMIAGWAVDDRGVKQIRIYVDNHLVNTGALTSQRPDVSKAFPRYVRGNHTHGFAIVAGFDAPGRHKVLVQAVDTDGATRDIAVLNVTAVDK
jgi:hypothetical protein